MSLEQPETDFQKYKDFMMFKKFQEFMEADKGTGSANDSTTKSGTKDKENQAPAGNQS